MYLTQVRHIRFLSNQEITKIDHKIRLQTVESFANLIEAVMKCKENV